MGYFKRWGRRIKRNPLQAAGRLGLAAFTGGSSELLFEGVHMANKSEQEKYDALRESNLSTAEKLRLMQKFETEQGMKEGEEKAKTLTADVDMKAAAEEELSRRRAAMDKGISAEQYAPVKQRMRTSSRAARAAGAAAGVRGGTMGQMLASTYRTGQETMGALDAAVRNKAEQDYYATLDKQRYLKLSLPLAYGQMRGGQASTSAQMAMASIPTPMPQQGLLSSILGPIV